MKRYVKFLFIIVISVLFALSFTGCKGCEGYPSKQEVTPSVLGKPEDCWLYKGNSRSRTDGTEEAPLFTEFIYDGNKYSLKQVTVWRYYYALPTHKIFFLLTDTVKKYYLYMYDYAEKSGECLSEFTGKIEVTVGSVVIIEYDREKIVYDLNGKRVEDNFGYYENDNQNGVFYSVYFKDEWQGEDWERRFFIAWWYNGVYHTSEFDEHPYPEGDRCEKYITEKRIYLDFQSGAIFSVNMETDEINEYVCYPEGYDSSKYVKASKSVQKIYYTDDSVYVLSLMYYWKDEENTDWRYYFYKAENGVCTLIREFDSGNYYADMGEYDGHLYFRFDFGGRGGRNKYTYYRYNLESGKLKQIWASEYFSGKLNNDRSYEQKKKVGDYTFYVTHQSYGGGYWTGSDGVCSYLNREHNGITEVMQYSFERTEFFDDICEF